MTISLRSTLKSGIVKCWSPVFKSDVLLWITSCLFHPLLTPKPFFGDLLKHLMMFCFFSWGNTLANFAIKKQKKKENDTSFYYARNVCFFIDFKEILQGYSNLKCKCCSLSSDKHQKEREKNIKPCNPVWRMTWRDASGVTWYITPCLPMQRFLSSLSLRI